MGKNNENCMTTILERGKEHTMTVWLIALVKPLERNNSYFHLKLISKLTKQDTTDPTPCHRREMKSV